MSFSAEQKRKAIEREIGKRERVYFQLVAAGKMTQAKADYEIAVMKDIANDYAGAAKKEQLL